MIANIKILWLMYITLNHRGTQREDTELSEDFRKIYSL